MTLSDDLRSWARSDGGLTDLGRSTLIAAADRIDDLESDNAASALLIADQAYRIGQLEAAIEGIRQAWVDGDEPDCEDVCMVACKGPCGVTP